MQAKITESPRSDGRFAWPGGARLAVVLTSEYEPEYAVPLLPGGFVNQRQIAEMRYEAMRGIWRVLETLDRHGARCTFFTNGATAERYPESVRAIAQRGHEVGAHSWNASDHFNLSRDDEDKLIGAVIGALQNVTGKKPTGWLTPRAQVSSHTVQLIAKHGFTWHSDCFDDDLPYTIDVDGKPLIEVPRSTMTDDYAMMGFVTARPFGSHREMLAMWIDEFDVLLRESRDAARLVSINWHQCMVGRPALSKVLDDFLTHVRRHSGVWMATGGDVAEFWAKNMSPVPRR